MKKKNDETAFMYKCRHCGKVISKAYCSSDPDMAHRQLINAIYEVPRTMNCNQMPVPMLDVHNCKKDQFGVCDLVGTIVE